MKLKGKPSENEQDSEDEDELGIEDAETDDDDESVDDRDLVLEDEDSEEDEIEDDDEDEDVEARADEDEDEDDEDDEDNDEDVDARVDEDEDEDEDWDLDARGEDEDEDEDDEAAEVDDDELAARGLDDMDEDDELQADEDEDEDEDDRGIEDDFEDGQFVDDLGPRHSAAEKRAALRSVGDSGELRSVSTTSEVRPNPRPAQRTQADKVIAIAKKQVGYREGKNNHTKYAAELIKAKIAQGWWQNEAWCQTFQSWVFAKAGLRELAPMTPGCATAVTWFRARKRVNQYPAIGAQVFYGPNGGTHVGLVWKYDPKRIWTIEGNTNDKGSAEGIGVFLKQRTRKEVYGYGYPKFADGIVTADPRKKGKVGFRFKKAAASGAAAGASEPDKTEKVLPWVSVNQIQWAATHAPAAERAAKAGAANPRGDVKLVQEALRKVLGVRSQDPAGIFEADTERLFARFRRNRLKMLKVPLRAKPGIKALSGLGRKSQLFRVRMGSMVKVDEQSGSTTPAKLSPRDVTFKRCTTPSSKPRINKWILQACKKAGATPSRAWLKGYNTMISRESSGNPNACNLWDSNAKTPPGYRKVKDFGDGISRQGTSKLKGRPTHFQCSRGIVQCIPQTFAHYHARGTSRNIYDPVACIASSMRYVMARYKVAKNGSNLARNVGQANPSGEPGGY
ncbi:MAG TPA: hypothetical protein VFN67_32900 [Polyangiales bacterium]|nr:hypothetical protein [Polyangiales bacterium]